LGFQQLWHCETNGGLFSAIALWGGTTFALPAAPLSTEWGLHCGCEEVKAKRLTSQAGRILLVEDEDCPGLCHSGFDVAGLSGW
jgi:hypothetical protein